MSLKNLLLFFREKVREFISEKNPMVHKILLFKLGQGACLLFAISITMYVFFFDVQLINPYQGLIFIGLLFYLILRLKHRVDQLQDLMVLKDQWGKVMILN